MAACFIARGAKCDLTAGHYKVDTKRISVSGLSSGAFFSVQFHVAFSSTIIGVGAVAGGVSPCSRWLDKCRHAAGSARVAHHFLLGCYSKV